MMSRLHLLFLCKKITVIYLNRGISTDTVLLMRARNGKVPQRIPYEPGIRHRRQVFQKDSDATEDVENEEDIDNEIDAMNMDEAYDINMKEKARNKIKLERIITAKKFFSPRPQPLMLTCNERQCIKYLHKEDPVQWDVKTLSESFPATPDTIKKIIKGKWKATPERAKLLDSKAQKNWELLAKGELDADPHVLEHMKKFINRRTVLLEQIKNEKFYLPEIKKEPVWNNGKFTNVLVKYEKDIKRLLEETEQAKMLKDGISEVKNEGEEKSFLNSLHLKVNETVSRKGLENKDSFLFGGLTKFYSKPKTLEELEDQILKKAHDKKRLSELDKAILENKLGVTNEKNCEENLTQTESFTPEKMKHRSELRGRCFEETHLQNESIRDSKMKLHKMKIEDDKCNLRSYLPPDSRTLITNETGIGELLTNFQNPHKLEEAKSEPKNAEDKPKIDFSDPERIRRENIYYDAEVNAIKNTSFWGNPRNSKEKALAESEKGPLQGPIDEEPATTVAKSSILSADGYPERIRIPNDKRRTGATFKVKDCYYDDDGEFLYRVPGMSN